ncbi:MAG: hypothetical protein CMG09_02035 [Candidatus Marinimicrobia bacterium]|nr:hypothetical protein [Candidatus Neomarinimicrobiota bacterium]
MQDCNGNWGGTDLYDCAGVCGGAAIDDECGVCGGDNSSCADCAGVVNGDATEDQCGVCDANPDNDCTQDCAGNWGGDAITDDCGICGGDNASCADCAGVANGDATEDQCGVCDANPDNNCTQDCAGTWGGDAITDDCGVCGGDNSSCADCAGVANGNSYIDGCGVCNDNFYDDCAQDCTGTWGGDALEDQCGICNGDGLSCVADLSLINFNSAGSIEIWYYAPSPIAGFQFDITGLQLESAAGGLAQDNGFYVEVSNAGRVIGFSLSGGLIPAGSGLLTTLYFNQITAPITLIDTDAVLVYPGGSDQFIVNLESSINHGQPDCLGVYYGGAFLNACDVCVEEGTIIDEDGDGEDDCWLDADEIPDIFTLSQNYPNPFNPVSFIDYALPNSDYLTMNIIDIQGRILKNIFYEKYHSVGKYTQKINGTDLKSGIYFIQLISSNNILSKKIIVLK